MDKVGFVKLHLEKERGILLKTIEKAKETRDSAQGPKESGSDTTRAQAEKLVFALEDKLENLEKIFPLLNLRESPIQDSISVWSLAEVKLGSQRIKIILVPEGIGGREIACVKLISTDTPLGKFLSGRKLNQKSEFNGQIVEILKVE